MPGFTTHYLFGVYNFRQLRQKQVCPVLQQSIAGARTVFQLGLQGPDVFFYHLPSQLKTIRPGSIAHTRWTGDFLKCLAESPELFQKEKDQSAARAYAAGFIGHYVLDTQMHPYVYDRTGTGDELKEKGYGDHIALESDIDAELLMRSMKRLPSEFPYGKTIAFDNEMRTVVVEILYYAYQMVFEELGLTRKYLAGAVRSMQIGTRLTYNPHNYKRQVLEKAERILFGHPQISPVIPSDHAKRSEDPLNLEHREWHNPWDTKQRFCSSVPDLLKQASKRYQQVLEQLERLYEVEPGEESYEERLEQLCEMIGQQSFHSGLDWILGE